MYCMIFHTVWQWPCDPVHQCMLCLNLDHATCNMLQACLYKLFLLSASSSWESVILSLLVVSVVLFIKESNEVWHLAIITLRVLILYNCNNKHLLLCKLWCNNMCSGHYLELLDQVNQSLPMYARACSRLCYPDSVWWLTLAGCAGRMEYDWYEWYIEDSWEFCNRYCCLQVDRKFSTMMLTILERVALYFFLGKKLYLNNLFCASVPLLMSMAAWCRYPYMHLPNAMWPNKNTVTTCHALHVCEHIMHTNYTHLF